MLINKDIVSKETATKAFKYGFDYLTYHYFNESNKPIHISKHESAENMLQPRGFNWNHRYSIDDRTTISAPLNYELQKWFREVHSIYIDVILYYNPSKFGDIKYYELLCSSVENNYDTVNENSYKRIFVSKDDILISPSKYYIYNEYNIALEYGFQKGFDLLENRRKK